jgi:hypothetical protein
MQMTADQFRGRGQMETYRLPTSMATNFCREVGNFVFKNEGSLQDIATKYGRRVEDQERGTVTTIPVPADMVASTVAEMRQRWGPSFRTYVVGDMYPEKVADLVPDIKIERQVGAELMRDVGMMMRMADIAQGIRSKRAVTATRTDPGGSRWLRVEITG